MKESKKKSFGFDAFGSMMICELKPYRIHRHTFKRYECSIFCILSHWTSNIKIVLLMNILIYIFEEVSKSDNQLTEELYTHNYTIIISVTRMQMKRNVYTIFVNSEQWTGTVQYLFYFHIIIHYTSYIFALYDVANLSNYWELMKRIFALDKHSTDWTNPMVFFPNSTTSVDKFLFQNFNEKSNRFSRSIL